MGKLYSLFMNNIVSRCKGFAIYKEYGNLWALMDTYNTDSILWI